MKTVTKEQILELEKLGMLIVDSISDEINRIESENSCRLSKALENCRELEKILEEMESIGYEK